MGRSNAERQGRWRAKPNAEPETLRSRSQPLGQRRMRRVPKVALKRQPEAEKQTELAG